MSSTISDGDVATESPTSVVADEPAPHQSRLTRVGFPTGFKPVRESALVVATILPILTVVYRLWDAHLKVPFSYSYDGLSTSAYVKSIVENGWYFHTPRLGAPFAADWRDFPVGGENLHWLALKIIGTVTNDYTLTVNIYFLLGFFLVGLSAYYVVRYLAFSVPTALVTAVVFAFLPYHTFRGENHLVRGVYYGVPLAVLALLWTMNYRTEFFTTDHDGSSRWRRGRVVVAIVIAVIVASSDTQNAAFFAALMFGVAIVEAVRFRDWRPLALLGIVVTVLFGVLLVNNAPTLLAERTRPQPVGVEPRPLGPGPVRVAAGRSHPSVPLPSHSAPR